MIERNAISKTRDAFTPPDRSQQTRRVKVAYVMSRFPKITETFILGEMLELEKLGFEIEVFPLQREKTSLVQPEAKRIVDVARFTPLISLAIVKANFLAAMRQAPRYFGILATLIWANLGSTRYLLGALLFFPKAVYLADLMKCLGIHHIHAHFASHPAAVAFVIERLSGISYSFVAHGSDLHRDQHMLAEKTRYATFVIAISDYNRRMILDVCGQEFASKVHVVHCGIDQSQFSPRCKPTPFDRHEGPFSILCVGTLHEVKGQTFLIEACRILAERGLDFDCHFIGEGIDEQALRRQTRRAQLNSCITFHGSRTSTEVRRQLEHSDVLVAPSVPSRDGRREGIPVVLMEAMACAVPCVSSRLTGIPELVENDITGILTDPGDAQAIADALERLSRDKALRSRLGTASVEKIRRHFCLADNTRELAEKVLATTRAGEGVH